MDFLVLVVIGFLGKRRVILGAILIVSAVLDLADHTCYVFEEAIF